MNECRSEITRDDFQDTSERFQQTQRKVKSYDFKPYTTVLTLNTKIYQCLRLLEQTKVVKLIRTVERRRRIPHLLVQKCFSQHGFRKIEKDMRLHGYKAVVERCLLSHIAEVKGILEL